MINFNYITPQQFKCGDRPSVEIPPEVYNTVRTQIDDIKARGESAIREYAERFDGLVPGQSLILNHRDLVKLSAGVTAGEWTLLESAAQRIGDIASIQAQSLRETKVKIPGGVTGFRYQPVAVAGCYAPGGRYPLPSSMLMTAITARAAGVNCIVAASPRPSPIIAAAAVVAGVESLISFGGAAAIYALATGVISNNPCNVICGPGNQYVTAAKNILSSQTRMDLPAGPSEITVVIDRSADLVCVSADLIAQAEHDPEAQVNIVTTEECDRENLQKEVWRQLCLLPSATATIALTALNRGLYITCSTIDEARSVVNKLAPEHLSLQLSNPRDFLVGVINYGVVLIGGATPVALADFGAGPNHTLPTNSTARSWGGLSVLNFLRVQYQLEMDKSSQSQKLISQAIEFARLEGLEGHAASLECRVSKFSGDEVPTINKNEALTKLDANESPFPPPTQLIPAMLSVFSQINRYPDSSCSDLRSAIGRFVNQPPEMILCGNGSDEILRLISQTFVSQGGKIATLWPTFSQYEKIAKQFGAEIVKIPWEVAEDADTLCSLLTTEKPDLTILTRPNSPCGRLLSREVVKKVSMLTGKLLVDEAYVEFCEDSILDLLSIEKENVMVSRTLSKACGMAGLRIGWLIAPPATISKINEFRDPYNCNSISQAVAVKFFEELVDEQKTLAKTIEERVSTLKFERTRITEELLKLGLKVTPSKANFLWLPIDQPQRIHKELLKREVSVRLLTFDLSPEEGEVQNISGLRLTVGLPK